MKHVVRQLASLLVPGLNLADLGQLTTTDGRGSDASEGNISQKLADAEGSSEEIKLHLFLVENRKKMFSEVSLECPYHGA